MIGNTGAMTYRPNNKIRYIQWVLGSALVVVLGLNVWWFGFRGPVQHPLEAQPAPAMELPLLSQTGEPPPFSLAAHGGKVVLIDFWATHCGPCKAQLPVIQRVHDAVDPAKVKIISVNLDFMEPEERRETVGAFIREGGFTFDVALAQDEVLSQWHIKRIPFMVLVDRQRLVASTHTGLRSEESLREEIEGLIH